MSSCHAPRSFESAPTLPPLRSDEEVVRVQLRASEIEWEIAPGRAVPAYAYNGRVPGPVIEAKQNVPLEVTFTNDLPEPTVVHWHGLRIPAAMDGTEITQPLVQPGETFVYRFTPPDAGMFWYHSHANETEQLEKGLYGALIVRGEDELQLDAERVLVLDDMRIDSETGDHARFGGLMDRHNGREGNVRLVNGIAEPDLAIAAGQIERWRLVNASSARYVRLSIGGTPFRILGTDGGLIEQAVEATEYLLTPGDRIDIAVGPFEEGEVLEIEDLPYNRMAGRKKRETFAMLRVGPRKPSVASIPDVLRTLPPRVSSEQAATRTVRLGFRLSLKRLLDFTVNGDRHHHGAPVKVGEQQVWDVVNETLMDHPFHLHGFFFEVLSVNGKEPAYRSLEDVVNVPPRSTVRIAWTPDDRPGSWMFHCHILEHHAAGMMGEFDVVR